MWSASSSPPSFSIRRESSSGGSSPRFPSALPAMRKVSATLLTTSVFCALSEYSSRQNAPAPISLRRLFTTSSAAAFSATKRTRCPRTMLFTMMLVMVCDFPVPGGPCRTKLFVRESLMAENCEESALMGRRMRSSPSYASSEEYSAMRSAVNSERLATSDRISRLSFNFSGRVRTSFHIR